MEGYKFISNLSNNRKDRIWYGVALKAAGINDYLLTHNAVDVFGNPIKDMLALYIKNTVPKRNIALFHQAFYIAGEQLSEIPLDERG